MEKGRERREEQCAQEGEGTHRLAERVERIK